MPVPGGACTDQRFQDAGDFLGVPNAALGYIFYATVAAFAFLKAISSSQIVRTIDGYADIPIGVALVYSGYLVYLQAFVIRAYCALCVVSAVLVTTLQIIRIIEHRQAGTSTADDGNESYQLDATFAQGAAFLGLAAALFVALFVDQLGTRNLDYGSSRKQIESIVATLMAGAGDSGIRNAMAWRVEESAPKMNLPVWLDEQTPGMGTGTSNWVAFFLDPNCPHCQIAFDQAAKAAKEFGIDTSFYVLPFVLWDRSLLQVQAIEVAKRYGKYHEMWKLQLTNQKPGGLKISDLDRMFKELGVEVPNLAQQLAEVLPAVKAQRSLARNMGIRESPAIYANGRFSRFLSGKDSGRAGRLGG